MSDSPTFVVETTSGKVELHGTGPWSVHEYGRGSYTIIDKNLAPARPTVHRKISYSFDNATKPDANVVWASSSTPNVIVAAANAALAAATK